MIVDQFPDRTIVVDGKTYLYFGGTSYLGMATNPEFQKLLYNSINIWGSAYGSSRNSNIQLSIYQKAEALLAKIIGAEAALTVSSGTLAGKLVIDYLAKNHEQFYHHPKTHPAILKNTSLPLFIDGKLHPRLTDDIKESVVIATDALLSLEVQPTNFDFLNDVSKSKKITLLIDESHSLGIVGAQGQGVFGTISHPSISQKLMISSLTKAYGCSGGVIAGDHETIQTLQNDAVFISASGMNPVFLQTLFDAQDILRDQLIKLRNHLDVLLADQVLTDLFHYDKNYPVIYCHSNAIFDYLKSQDIIITNFKYPNYDTMMNRIVISANHTASDLKRLKSVLINFQKETLH